MKLNEFLEATSEQERSPSRFELETERMLDIDVGGEVSMVYTKMGSMVAFTGDLKFTREGILEQGFGKMLKKAVSGEGAKLTRVEGDGKLFLADEGKKITVFELDGDALVVNGNDLLAFEPSVDWDIKMMKKLTAMIAGGLFNVRLEGHGLVAVTTHHDPVTFRVTPNAPLCTDPNATVAWSGSLEPEFKTDVSLKTFFGRGSGESIQMRFQGDGFVVVQPYEEVPLQVQSNS